MQTGNTKKPMTLMEAIRFFENEAVCVEFLCKLRYDLAQPVCIHCGSLNIGKMNTRPKFQCREKECRKQFSMKKGTIMEDSPIPLTKWMPAIWMLVNDKNGISSYELGRALGITHKSAWFMLHRIRHAMQQGSFMKMTGQVEIDETYIGGKGANMSKYRKIRAGMGTGRSQSNKTVVMGVVERGGKIVAKVVDNVRKHTLLPEVSNLVEPGTTVYTDSLKSYEPLKLQYNHKTIDHNYAFVQGDIHTNTLENFWCLLKRSIKGTYVQVAPFHADRYVTEQAFRYNHRKTNDGERFVRVLSQIFDKRLTYKELTGNLSAT